jgi:hypothetical protein
MRKMNLLLKRNPKILDDIEVLNNDLCEFKNNEELDVSKCLGNISSLKALGVVCA